jgi:2,5-diketo-D-gluconate reductase A
LPNRYGGDFVSTWNTLEEFRADGRARSIGVSNFQPSHLERLAAGSDTVPAVNQIESHPYLTNDRVRDYCRERGIAVEAWSPLARGGVLEEPAVTAVAERAGKTPAQVVLRWHLQRGNIVFPKSVTPSRIRENFDLFDFKLGADDMEAITLLDRREEGRVGSHPDA